MTDHKTTETAAMSDKTTERSKQLIEAVETWVAAKEAPSDPEDVELFKALWTYRGERPGCLTIEQAHKSLDQRLIGLFRRKEEKSRVIVGGYQPVGSGRGGPRGAPPNQGSGGRLP